MVVREFGKFDLRVFSEKQRVWIDSKYKSMDVRDIKRVLYKYYDRFNDKYVNFYMSSCGDIWYIPKSGYIPKEPKYMILD